MSQTTVKAARREIRRAVGEGALATIGEAQNHIERLANSIAHAHQRLDEFEAELGTIHRAMMRESLRLDAAFDLINFSLWQRLRWLVTGR